MIRSTIAFLMVMVPLAGWCQEQRVSLQFQGQFEGFSKELGHLTGITFFFKREWVDSLHVEIRAENETLKEVLDRVLEPTQLQWAIFQNQVFITPDKALITELPVAFFQPSQGGYSPANLPAYQDPSLEKKKNEAVVTVIGQKKFATNGQATISGAVRDAASGEALVGASVFIENPLTGTTTDPFGNFSLTLPAGRHMLVAKSIGMKALRQEIILYSNGRIDLEMEEDITPLKEVLVHSERDVRVSGLQMGVEKLDIKVMKNIPLALGETDVMKVILTLPGVQTVGEGTSGLNVRGGATHQNLILFNDAVVFNPSHLFGFFSTFNPDALKSVELYKSGITADYGGRLSSILDVRAREGNLKKFTGSGGLSPITGRFTLEGPIIKEKASFMVGGRSSYSNWILRQLEDSQLSKSEASFYDITSTLNYQVNPNNSLFGSAYYSKDYFRLGKDTSYYYSDRNASIKWKHSFHPKLFGSLTGALSQYSYSVESEENPTESFRLRFFIQQAEAKADFTYLYHTKHTLSAGINTIAYQLRPGSLVPAHEESLVIDETVAQERALESAVYVGDQFEVTNRLSLYAGLRYSLYQFLGPRDVYIYRSGVPLQPTTVVDTVRSSGRGPIGNYHGPEPRISMRYLLAKNASVKVSFNRTRQYIQMLSNTTAITPTDIWKLSDGYIEPQLADQISVGLYKNLRNNTIEASLEAYYKDMQNMIDFKGGATLLLNPQLETEVVNAEGKAYGAELLLKKPTGKINGWVSYTYSRSLLRTSSVFSSENINRGKYYPSSFDKPHAFNFIGNYKVNRRLNFGFNLVYSTGRPVTLPIAKYQASGNSRVFYSERNQYRIPDYFRTDVSLNIEGNHKIKKLAHSSWTFAIYNATGRRNAYSVFFTSQGGVINGYKLSVFGQPIPTITYNFKF